MCQRIPQLDLLWSYDDFNTQIKSSKHEFQELNKYALIIKKTNIFKTKINGCV